MIFKQQVSFQVSICVRAGLSSIKESVVTTPSLPLPSLSCHLAQLLHGVDTGSQGVTKNVCKCVCP